jgi:hypothetical protein
MNKFIVGNSGDNWLICWTGCDNDGEGYSVTTDHVHGSDLHNYTLGAKGDAELIARLLNWYYENPDAEQTLERNTQ